MPELKLDELREIQAEACKIFGNAKRILILESIWDRRMSYTELLEKTGLDKVTLTQQTALMRRKGILRSERTPQGLTFFVTNPKILKSFALMRETVLDRIKEESDLLTALRESSDKKDL
jgi:DNA-binding transcriptional ArsR family regulator